jgi:RNA-directed DNA polymerase
MRRIGGVWDEVVSPDNLDAAYRKARRGKRFRDDVAAFAMGWEEELLRLRQQLKDRTYVPGKYRRFVIYERKPRVISAAPFRDRVVHHALMGVLEPHLERRFFARSYACRPGKGVHAAVDYYQSWARRYTYVLKLDVRSFFPSVNRILLLDEIERHVKDPGCLWLFRAIIHGAEPTEPALLPVFPGDDPDPRNRTGQPCGLPIGNLTSQILANLFLNRLDHWIAAHHPGRYLRYVDDLLLLDDDKDRLWTMRDAIAEKLAGQRLMLHPNKAQVMRTDRKVDVLGYQVSRRGRWLRGENVRRTSRRLRGLKRAFETGRVEMQTIKQSTASWIGHVKHASAWGLCRRMLRAAVPSWARRKAHLAAAQAAAASPTARAGADGEPGAQGRARASASAPAAGAAQPAAGQGPRRGSPAPRQDR